jgi:hypothetical protein
MFQSFIHGVGVSDILFLAIAYVIPLLSALATKAPSTVTGIITTVLAIGNGLLVEAYQSGDHYDWGKGLTNAVVALFIAFAVHAKVWAGGTAEKKAYASLNHV